MDIYCKGPLQKIGLFLLLLPTLFLFSFLTGCGQAPTGGGEKNPSEPLKIHGDYHGCGIGVFLEDGDPASSEIDSFESLISREVSVVMWFKDFTCTFPTSACAIVSAHKAVPVLTWEPRNWSDESDTSYSLDNIIAGNCDTYIRNFALAAKSWRKPFFLRFAHEMNGDWYPWSGSPSNYIAAWRRIHATFEALGVSNATWVWCPNDFDIPSGNNAESYYPGDSYVDWVGFDGYSYSGTSFDDLFYSIYSSLISLYNKPVMIGEMARGTGEADSKPVWITDAFEKIKNNYQKIKIYVWFNLNKESGWRVDTSSESLTAFRASMTDEAYYLSKIK